MCVDDFTSDDTLGNNREGNRRCIFFTWQDTPQTGRWVGSHRSRGKKTATTLDEGIHGSTYYVCTVKTLFVRYFIRDGMTCYALRHYKGVFHLQDTSKRH